MKKRMVLLAALLGSLGIHAFAVNEGEHFFTTALPEPDRAEIYTVTYYTVTARRQCFLKGESARTLAALVRSQSLINSSKNCDVPRYGIRFYQGGKLIADETICFDCQVITPKASDLHAVTGSENFDSHAPQAKQLQAYLNQTLPLTK
jgi:hypothetical protein